MWRHHLAYAHVSNSDSTFHLQTTLPTTMATTLSMDPFQSNLQVPDLSAGPSRSQTHNRPISVQPTSTSASPSSTRKRASHSVVTGQQEPEPQPTYRDVYSHPAALEYAAAHPRRTIPKFGPYLLLQTLGEGEFGKVKLGLHMQWGEEVAVKLIRRGNIDSSIRMSKVEREIEVLRVRSVALTLAYNANTRHFRC